MELLTGNIFTELTKAFTKLRKRSEVDRLKLYEEMMDFYDNAYECIVEYLKIDTKNNPFSEETLKKLKFRHVNVIDQDIREITSGIFTKDPLIEFEGGKPEDNKKLSTLLEKVEFVKKVKDAFKKAVYINIIEAHVVYDEEEGQARIDIITPNKFAVETQKDYLKKRKIAIQKTDEEGQIYWAVWTEEEHYIMYNDDQKAASIKNTDMVNPYAAVYGKDKRLRGMPFATLRIEEGCDYYGEPNWNIFLHQKNLDIRLTDLNESEVKTIHQILLGINTNFSKDETFKAGTFKQVNKVKEGEKDPDIKSIISDVPYDKIRDNIDWANKLVLKSEGLSENSASTDRQAAESGSAKLIDMIALLEQREEFKTTLYYFIIHLLEVLRMVHNTYSSEKINDKLPFAVQFTNSRVFETIEDKKARYDLGKENGYMDEVDVTQEELEIPEDEAIKRIQERQARAKKLGLKGSPEPNPDNPGGNPDDNPEGNPDEPKEEK